MIPLRLLPLQCGVQHYSWGVRARAGQRPLIADLLNLPAPEQLPFAELWVGAHPKLPAAVLLPDGKANLLSLVAENAAAVLGSRLAGTGASSLPFLLKILSCEQALSIQAHPDAARAVRLHAAAPQHYPDANHKPEIAIALTPFEALAGFRPTAAIRRDLLRLPALTTFFAAPQLKNAASSGAWLRVAYARVFETPQCEITAAIEALQRDLSHTATLTGHDRLFQNLQELYPDDRGRLSVYFLNLLHLEPGEAFFVGPNMPHAYLQGSIIECMANSDNVVRAGLTPKFIDVPVLLEMLTYRGGRPVRLRPRAIAPGEQLYCPPVAEFRVLALRHGAGTRRLYASDGQVSVLLVLKGRASMADGGSAPLDAPAGSIWLWPAGLDRVTITFAASETEIIRVQPNFCVQ